MRVSVLGENKTTGVISIYSALVSLPDDVTIDCGNILGKSRGNNPIYNCFGNLAGRTKTEVQIEDKTLDVGLIK